MSVLPGSQTGRFGPYGGRYVPETLVPALEELEAAWREARGDPGFLAAVAEDLRDFGGRPTPLSRAGRLTEAFAGAEVWLKREDLLHTGAHKLNNTVGQVRLALRMGKRRIIAETGAGQHGVATAATCARFGLECQVFMGAEDVRRQAPNVQRMRLFGAAVRSVESGSRTLKDAMNEAIRAWVSRVGDTFYVIGSVAGPHPYPSLVRDLQRVIGVEARAQCLQRFGALPDAVVACVGGGSNALGAFSAFVDDAAVRLVAVEAGGEGLATGRHGASLSAGRFGVLHGSASSVLQTPDGQVAEAHSVSAGLDYPGVGPELAHLRDTGRLEVRTATDDEALDAFTELCRLEGILPALETSHALARARDVARELGPGRRVLVNLSGRGDKDLVHALAELERRGRGAPR
ncbi:MAG TPA: tryptophan synthase subunit beta [Myxococcaceae bacterium]|nr:tryptophan synthase subunit beta [Myxococcaceae bacterium]